MLKHVPSSFAIFAAFFAAFGTLFFVVGAHTFYRNCQFSGAVLRVTGTVLKRYTTTSHGRHGSSTTYHLKYSFQKVGWGGEYHSEDSVQSQTYYSLKEHAPVPIKYLPLDPAVSRIDLPIEDRNHEFSAWLFMGIGGLFGGLGWYFFYYLEKLILYRRWLRRNGVRRIGTVDRIEVDTNIEVNHRNPRYLVYTYTDATGQTHQDSSQALPLKQEELWKTGDPIDVFYDPRDFNKSTVTFNRQPG